MARRRYLLLYDIRDDERLRHVHDIAVAFGEPLQYSVFVCDVTKAELIKLKASLADVMNTRVDSVAIVDLGDADNSSKDRFYFLGYHRALPESVVRIV
jgi:CRISPR-associated protein Cas2